MTIAPAAPDVIVDGPRMSVRFDRFDLDAYGRFITAKSIPESELTYDWRADCYTLTAPARFAALFLPGMTPDAETPTALAGHLFDYQAFIVTQALAAQRFAIWADTGLGKTSMFLEWARQVVARTHGRVLILSPLKVIPQTVDEAARWYGDDFPIDILRTREQLTEWCVGEGPGVAICNYDKLIPGILPELRYCAGLVLDESSLLKTGGGTIKWNLIKSARGIPYKLSCTATPAPNDTMEYASQASFLEKLRGETDILWTFFTCDRKSGRWTVKPHAREAFYRFMATWSIYMRDPSHYGFADILATLPPPEIIEETIPITDVQRELRNGLLVQKGAGLFTDDRLGVAERSRLSQVAKGFLYDGTGKNRTAARIETHKPARVAEIICGEVASGNQVLVWTVFDEESEIIAEYLRDGSATFGMLHGRMSEDESAEAIRAFKRGDFAVLITKAQLAGYGLNFQNVRAMVFSGFDDSFERMYQAIRRAYRYGQTETVRVYVPYIPELEGMMFTNVKRKEQQFNDDVAIQERNYVAALEGLDR